MSRAELKDELSFDAKSVDGSPDLKLDFAV